MCLWMMLHSVVEESLTCCLPLNSKTQKWVITHYCWTVLPQCFKNSLIQGKELAKHFYRLRLDQDTLLQMLMVC